MLSRDFKEKPLGKKEEILKEDLHYLFKELNWSRLEVAQYFGCSESKVQKAIKKYNLTKTKEERTECRKRTTLRLYGSNNVSQCNRIKEKREATNMERYGSKNAMQNTDIKNRLLENNRNKYGVQCIFSISEIKEKIKNTNLDRYGVENVLSNKGIQDKVKETNIERYGTENPQNNKEIREKIYKTNLERYGNKTIFGSTYFKEKSKETFIENYGVDNPAKSPIVKETWARNCKEKYGEEGIVAKLKQSNIERYGTEWPIEKINETKRKNNTFNTSKPEDDCYELLVSKFKEVERSYTSSLYPFNCDFYIPSLNLFIEYQGSWTHGPRPFLDTIEDNELLDKWKDKSLSSDYFKNAIETWTIRDVKKRETAILNGLNWIEFFSFNDFLEWFKAI